MSQPITDQTPTAVVVELVYENSAEVIGIASSLQRAVDMIFNSADVKGLTLGRMTITHHDRATFYRYTAEAHARVTGGGNLDKPMRYRALEMPVDAGL